MRHIIYVSIIIVVLTAALLFVVNSFDLMPVAASAEAGPIDWLFNLQMEVIAFLYVLVNGVLLYSVFVFRRKKGDESDGAYFHGHTGLEIVWTIVPLGVVLFFAFLGATILQVTTAASPDEMDVVVTGRQWSWTFEYPEYDLASTELNLPVDRKIHLILESEDVTHSFWVPEFRVKQDTVPGQTKDLRITPTELGTYKLRCAELCGTSHAYMLANVNVMEEADFDIWVQKRLGTYVPAEGEEDATEDVDPLALGAQVAQNAGCVACHSLDGSALVGPTWQGLLGRTEVFVDGSSQVADEDYIRTSITDVHAQVVEGYADVMPDNYGDILTPDELDALIAYISSL